MKHTKLCNYKENSYRHLKICIWQHQVVQNRLVLLMSGDERNIDSTYVQVNWLTNCWKIHPGQFLSSANCPGLAHSDVISSKHLRFSESLARNVQARLEMISLR